MGPDDETDDLVQEILVTLFTRIGTLRNPALFDAWVARITKNKVLHKMRERTLRRRMLDTWQASRDPIFEVDLDGRVIASRVLAVFEQLSPNQRALLSDHWFTPGNVNELAARWGCSVSTLRRRLDRAQARFEIIARHDAALARLYAQRRAPEADSRRAAVTR